MESFRHINEFSHLGRRAAVLFASLVVAGCSPEGDESAPSPDIEVATQSSVDQAAPLEMDRQQLWQYITTGDPSGTQPPGKLPSDPFYARWPLFPGPGGNPHEFLDKRLGLATHGRWVTVHVNPVARKRIEAYLDQVESVPVDGTPVVPVTTFPPGSVIVKVNYPNDPDATTVTRASAPRVLTVAYKPESGFCQTGVKYNGADCLGGEWLWAFYGLGKVKALDEGVAGSAGTFCVNCHVPAFKADNLRGLLSRARDIAFERVPATDPRTPGDVPDDDPFCEQAELSYAQPADVAVDPASISDPAKRQRLFDCFAWRSFVALNWPAGNGDDNRRGEPDTEAPFGRSEGARVWETLAQTYEVFQPDAPDWMPPPNLFDTPRRIPAVCSDASEGDAVISMVSKSQSHAADLANETGQAFAGTFGTLTDRNGNLVHYQVLLDETEFGFLLKGGKAVTRNLTPVGPADGPEPLMPDGSTEVKAAWKELCTGPDCAQRDDPTDYYTRTVWIYDADGPTCESKQVGLVGLHIATKTFWAPQWIWATFEHRDNAPQAKLVVDGTPPDVPPGDYLFYDNNCPPDPRQCFTQPFLKGAPAGANPCCPNLELNRFPKLGFDRSHNNQMIRLDPIGGSGLNERFRKAMAEAGSPLASFILVNTQWPMNGRRPANTESPERFANTRNCADNTIAADGSCYTRVPADLRNTVIESYMTTWVNNEQGHPQQISNRSCMSCHDNGTSFSFIFEDAVEMTVSLGEQGED